MPTHRSGAVYFRIEKEGIHLLLDHMANIIDPHKKQAKMISKNGKSSSLEYDQLVIGTGAVSVEPDIEGLQFPGVFTLQPLKLKPGTTRYTTRVHIRCGFVSPVTVPTTEF